MKFSADVGTISYEELTRLLEYSEETGEFRWRIWGQGRKPGKPAGALRANNYWGIIINGRQYLAHRLAWFYVTGKWPELQVDHIDGNGINNRFNNLREASYAQQRANTPYHNTNTSGYRWVFWDAHKCKWLVQMRKNGKYTRRLFDNKYAAVMWSKETAAMLFGDYNPRAPDTAIVSASVREFTVEDLL